MRKNNFFGIIWGLAFFFVFADCEKWFLTKIILFTAFFFTLYTANILSFATKNTIFMDIYEKWFSSENMSFILYFILIWSFLVALKTANIISFVKKNISMDFFKKWLIVENMTFNKNLIVSYWFCYASTTVNFPFCCGKYIFYGFWIF